MWIPALSHFFLCFFLLSASLSAAFSPPSEIAIGGLFVVDWSESYWERYIAAATLAAVDIINSRNDILPQTKLKMQISDISVTRTLVENDLVSPAQFSLLVENSLIDAIDRMPRVPTALIGPGYSSEAIALSPYLDQRDLLSVVVSTTSPVLSNRTTFPDLVKICPPDSYQGLALADLVKSLELTSCQIITCSSVYCSGLSSKFAQHAKAMDIAYTMHLWYMSDLSGVKANLSKAVASCVASKTFVLLMTDVEATNVFLAAQELNVLHKIIWIGGEGVSSLLPKDLPPNYIGLKMSSNHSSPKMQELKSLWAQGPIHLSNSAFGNVSIPSADMWESYSYIPLAYDAVFALAYAFQTLIERNQSVDNTTALKEAFLEVQFYGVSGYVAFNSDLGPKDARYNIEQKISNNTLINIGSWTSHGGLTFHSSEPALEDGAVGVCQKIVLGGMFVVSWNKGYADAQAAAAAKVAAMMINEDKTLLSGIDFQLDIGDTSAVRAIAQNGFLSGSSFQSVRQNAMSTIVKNLSVNGATAVVGPGFSSETILTLTAMKNLQLDMFDISYSSTSDVLSNITRFPNFARTCPSDNLQGQAIADVLAHFKWQRCQLIGCQDVYCTGLAERFLQRSQELGIVVEQTFFWEFGNPSGTKSLLKTMYDNCSNTRLYILAMHNTDALELFDAAKAIGASGKIIWLGSESVTSLASGLPVGYIGMKVGFNETNPQFARMKNFWGRLDPNEYPGLTNVFTNPYLVLSYDATYAVARAFDAMIKKGLSVFNVPAIVETFRSLRFEGASGLITFNRELDPSDAKYDLVNTNENGTISVAQWEAGTITYLVQREVSQQTWLNVALTWPGGNGPNIEKSCPSISTSNSQTVLAIVLSTTLIFAFFCVVALLSWYYCCKNTEVEDHDVEIIRMIHHIRHQLKLTRRDGFLTSKEVRYRKFVLTRRRMTVIDYQLLEHLARLALVKDFELKYVNAMCSWLRSSAIFHPLAETETVSNLSSFEHSHDHGGSLQSVVSDEQMRYYLLGDFVVGCCEAMLMPDDSPEKSSTEGLDDFETRFAFFLEKATKINIWHDDELNLFPKLKAAVSKHMAMLGQHCQTRFQNMQKEAAGEKLVVFQDSHDPPRRYSPYKQSDDEVGAIRMHEEDAKEMLYQEENKMIQVSPSGYRVHNEDVFISQLHLRAKLINHAFQKRVLQVIQSHEVVGRTRSHDKEPTVHWEEAVLGSSDQSTICVDFDDDHNDILHHSITMDCKFEEGVRRVEVSFAPVKSLARMSQKLFKYADPLLRCVRPYSGYILDPVRLSVICEGPKKILEIFEWFNSLDESSGIKVCRVKNKFIASESQEGYRDLTIGVLFTTNCGMKIIGEIQLHDKKIHQMKIKMHKLYRILRAESTRGI
uniref:Receptor ligand binding region domain-containing protein n=1 Tax=Guillardia theta TaxID=55529 RepID=A0A7S4P8H4_GUITH|mmetsp:Transcript_45019/g.141724  ORF Transcript_45019/g.141724 Transcript_45019/m.141724 type:complete len:1388 (+) Transcript_45019:53-4216(+)